VKGGGREQRGGWVGGGRDRENRGVGAEGVGGREVFDKRQIVPEASAQLKSHATSSSWFVFVITTT